MSEAVSPRTNVRILKKESGEYLVQGERVMKFHFVVEGRSFSTVGFISKVEVEESVYRKYEVNGQLTFELCVTKYPFMELGKVIE